MATARADLSVFQIGQAVGHAMMIFSLPAAAAFLVWRGKKHDERSKTVTFYLVLLGLTAIGVAQAARTARSRAALAQAQAEQKAFVTMQRDAVARGGPADFSSVREHHAKSQEQLDTAARTTTGSEAAIIQAQRVLNDSLMRARLDYENATKQLGAKQFFDLTRLTSAEQIAADREKVEAFAKANAALGEAASTAAFRFAQELKDRNVPSAELQRAMTAFQTNTSGKLGWIAKIRATDAEMTDVMRKFLDLAEANLGQWRKDEATQKLVFENSSAAHEYNELGTHLKALQTRQRFEQAEALSPTGR